MKKIIAGIGSLLTVLTIMVLAPGGADATSNVSNTLPNVGATWTCTTTVIDTSQSMESCTAMTTASRYRATRVLAYDGTVGPYVVTSTRRLVTLSGTSVGSPVKVGPAKPHPTPHPATPRLALQPGAALPATGR